MEITCETCKARLNIPDDKIPKDHRATISCPKCKNTLTLDPYNPKRQNPVSVAERGVEKEQNRWHEETNYGDEDASLDFFEEGLKLALLMETDPQRAEKLKRTVEELGYRGVLARNTRDAVSKMRLHHFDLVFLSDQFDEIDLKQSPVRQHMNNLSMSVRRRVFFALIGDNFKTMDHMMAFAMSANMVINNNDLDRLTAILKHAISDNEKFYKVFMDTMAEVGKA